MELERQVVSLELAKKLKELGVPQESLFFWCSDYQGIMLLSQQEYSDNLRNKTPQLSKIASAFTVAELGEMLPEIFRSEKYKRGKWICHDGRECTEPITEELFEADTEADARAKMLIYLLENNLIKKEELKK